MKLQSLKWCGEGDLFSRGVLKTSKLYTSQSSESSESARSTKSSHTVSHTGFVDGLKLLITRVVLSTRRDDGRQRPSTLLRVLEGLG
jgi:hypothetical protein